MAGVTGASGLLIAFIFLVVLVSRAAPTLIAVMNAALPLTFAIGLVVAVLRLVWHFTDRY